MDSPVTVAELLAEYELDEKRLKKKCTDTHLTSFVRSEKFVWREWAELLGLSEQQIKEIEDDVSLDNAGKSLKALGRWRDRNGFKANYLLLIETFLKGGNASLAEELCELVKERKMDESPQCTECALLQVTFLTQLKEQLKLFKNLDWSEETRSTTMKQAIREYVGKFVKAGCTSIDHLCEHLQNLYKKDFLISNRALVEDAEQYARLLSLKERSRDPSPGQRSTVTTPLQDKKADPLFSKPFVYHASVCCRIVNEHTHENYRDFFKDKVSPTGHTFKELSISRSKKGRYLVAKQNSSTYYIAFQSEPDVSKWPGKYESFTEGISSQREKFPVHFIVELLHKDNRVVLTGFSFGGVLACSILAQVWNLSNRTSDFLQRNLVCITFGQPHLTVPQLDDRSYTPEIATTIHSVLCERDLVPRLLGLLDRQTECFEDFCKSSEQLLAMKVSQQLFTELRGVSTKVELAKAVPAINQLVTYHLLFKDKDGPVFEEMSFETLAETPSYQLQLRDAASLSSSLDKHSMADYFMVVRSGYIQKDPAYKVPSSVFKPSIVSELKPNIRTVELHKHESQLTKNESELAFALEGTNLWFYKKLVLFERQFGDAVKSQSISGTSVKVNFSAEDNDALSSLHNGLRLTVGIQTHFDPHWQIEVKVKTKKYVMSKRQQQLAKCTPSQVIEVSYLSALLEQQPPLSVQPLSNKMTAITKFLERVVKIVPLESLGYSVAYAKRPHVRQLCAKTLEKIRKLRPSVLMIDALTQAKKDCIVCSRTDTVPDPETGVHVQEGTTRRPTEECLCHSLSQLLEQMGRIDGKTDVICDLNIETLYPVTNSIKSPIDTLRLGKETLSTLSAKTKANTEMLMTVNDIRDHELAVCVSLLGSFMDQQEIKIPLCKGDLELAENVAAKASVGVWALSSLSLDGVEKLLDNSPSKELVVDIDDYLLSVRDKESQMPSEDSQYASKLRFMVQGLNKTVTCNSQYVSYSLEQQLADLCKGRGFTKSESLDEITSEWDDIFKENILSLVATSNRPMIARWLKWALMIHDLREELASYTTIGVVGLVNAGKSTLVKNLFKLEIPSGTTDDKRTTVPFIYNLKEKVEGLDVVDFPGVDDRDESISDLADLLLTLAQIIIFVVDYKKVHTESGKKWLERLQVEKVPVLVCLTYADKFYAEHMTEGRYPEETYMTRKVKEELEVIEKKLNLPLTHRVRFCSFSQDNDSKLNCDEGRQRLRGVGIDSPKEVGDWLVDTFKKSFLQDKLAERLTDFFFSS